MGFLIVVLLLAVAVAVGALAGWWVRGMCEDFDEDTPQICAPALHDPDLSEYLSESASDNDICPAPAILPEARPEDETAEFAPVCTNGSAAV